MPMRTLVVRVLIQDAIHYFRVKEDALVIDVKLSILDRIGIDILRQNIFRFPAPSTVIRCLSHQTVVEHMPDVCTWVLTTSDAPAVDVTNDTSSEMDEYESDTDLDV